MFINVSTEFTILFLIFCTCNYSNIVHNKNVNSLTTKRNKKRKAVQMYKCYRIPMIDIAIILDKLETVVSDLQGKDLMQEAQAVYEISKQLNEVAKNNIER